MLVLKAINFAAEKHRGQERRESGLPYVIHPIIVAHLLGKYKISKRLDELQAAALLHDVKEDCVCTWEEIEREFGELVASIVRELTTDKEMAKKMGKNAYLMQKMLEMSKYAFVLKLIDRLSNVMDGPKENYIHDTIVLVGYLRVNRKDLTTTHHAIMDEIERVCEDFLKAANKIENAK